MNSDDLDLLFKQARRTTPLPSADLMTRIQADALAEQPVEPGVMTVPSSPEPRGRFAQALQMIGGWPAMAGLACAALTGVWIGVSPPEVLVTPLNLAFGGDTAALLDVMGESGGFDFSQYEG